MTVTARRAVEDVHRIAEQRSEDLFDRVAARLRSVVPFDGELWFGADPATGLATAPVRIERIQPGHCDAFWHREFLVDDLLLFRDVARAARPVGTLGPAARRSTRYREFLAPQGYQDELRTVFRIDGEVWGFASLLREHGRPPFSAAEAAVVEAVGAPLAAALRALAGRTVDAADVDRSPGLLVFDADGALMSLDDAAREWLDELPPGPMAPAAVPMPSQVIAAVGRARAIAGGRADGQARMRLRSRTGRWIVIHASCLGAGGPTAVIIEPARAAEVAPLIVRAYELSAREQEIARLIARGASTQEMARGLFLSPHTVRDHVKAIFEKVGVSSRGELVAKVFAEHYAPALHAAAA